MAASSSRVGSHVQLPVEVWHLIIEFVDSSPRDQSDLPNPFEVFCTFLEKSHDAYDPCRRTKPRDLKSLRQVDQAMCAITSPKLFRTIEIRPFQTNVAARIDKFLELSAKSLMSHVDTICITTRRPATVFYRAFNAADDGDCFPDADQMCRHSVWELLRPYLDAIGPRFTNLKAIMTHLEEGCCCEYTGIWNNTVPQDYQYTFVADFPNNVPARGLDMLSIAPDVLDRPSFRENPHYLRIKLSTIQSLAILDDDACLCEIDGEHQGDGAAFG